MTLDSNATPITAAFDPNTPSSYHYKSEVNVFDSLGQTHAVTLYFTKSAANTWEWNAGVDGSDVGAAAGSPVIIGTGNYNATTGNNILPTTTFPNATTEVSGDAVFSADVVINGVTVTAGQTVASTALGGAVIAATSSYVAGTTITAGNVITLSGANTLGFGSGGELLTEVGAPILFPWVSASAGSIGFDFGDAVTTDQQVAGAGGLGLNGTVQLAGSFATRGMTRDGFTSGFLDRLETDSTGRIFGVFTNGQRRPIFQVALANFPNDSVLTSVGNNLKQETIASGTPVLEKPGNGGMGTITPFGLEQSNVDLAGEFVKLIVVQRGYEANSKTILTTDQMLSALMQIKR